MSFRAALKLAWSDHQDSKFLTISGWNKADLDQLKGKAEGEIGEYLAVLPTLMLEHLNRGTALQPIPGTFHVDQESVRFEPRFPFLRNTLYSLIVYDDTEYSQQRHFETYTIKSPPSNQEPITEIVSVYPPSNQIPVNQLKFYIHFSNPMSEGNASQAITLHRGDTGAHLENVFLHEPELWDHEHKRLTILLDPARIKRGLQGNIQSGYALVEGIPVTLGITENFVDAHGVRVKSSRQMTYEIGPPERSLVEINNWAYHYPRPNSLDPIAVEFDRPMDHALIHRCLCIKDESGQLLRGYNQVGLEEKSWELFPEFPWGKGQYTIIIEDILEDLAGNSIKRVFDRDLLEPEHSSPSIPVTTHSFFARDPITKPGITLSNMIDKFQIQGLK